jgi:hypothetical protein
MRRSARFIRSGGKKCAVRLTPQEGYPVAGRQVTIKFFSTIVISTVSEARMNGLGALLGCAACTGHRGAWFVLKGAPAPSKFSFPTGPPPRYLPSPDPLIGSPGEDLADSLG